MSDYRIVVKMSQNGRSSKDAHHMVFRAARAGAMNLAIAKPCSDAVIAALASVMFAQTSFLRTTFTKLDENHRAVRGTTFPVGSSAVGEATLAVGDVMAPEHVVLAIEKSAVPSGSGISALRHAISSNEFNAYTKTSAVPARFTTLVDANDLPQENFATRLLAAFEDNGFTLKLAPKVIEGVFTERIVGLISVHDFRLYDPFRTKKSAVSKKVDGVLSQLKAWAAQAWRMFKKYVVGEHPADVISTIVGLAAKASAAYLALDVTERILIDMPAFPQLGGA